MPDPTPPPPTAAEMARWRELCQLPWFHPLSNGAAAARTALPRLLDEVEACHALLRELEWCGGWSEEFLSPTCPDCGRPDAAGHAPGCAVAARLAGGEG